MSTEEVSSESVCEYSSRAPLPCTRNQTHPWSLSVTPALVTERGFVLCLRLIHDRAALVFLDISGPSQLVSRSTLRAGNCRDIVFFWYTWPIWNQRHGPHKPRWSQLHRFWLYLENICLVSELERLLLISRVNLESHKSAMQIFFPFFLVLISLPSDMVT